MVGRQTGSLAQVGGWTQQELKVLKFWWEQTSEKRDIFLSVPWLLLMFHEILVCVTMLGILAGVCNNHKTQPFFLFFAVLFEFGQCLKYWRSWTKDGTRKRRYVWVFALRCKTKREVLWRRQAQWNQENYWFLCLRLRSFSLQFCRVSTTLLFLISARISISIYLSSWIQQDWE